MQFAFARAGQKVGHVGIEPNILAADAPQPKRSVAVLARQQTLNRLAKPLIGRRIERDMRVLGEIAHVEQRQRTARDLFRAAVRVAIKRGQERRRIECGRRADRQRTRAGAGHKIGEKVAGYRDTSALGDGTHGAPRQNLGWLAHGEGA